MVALLYFAGVAWLVFGWPLIETLGLRRKGRTAGMAIVGIRVEPDEGRGRLRWGQVGGLVASRSPLLLLPFALMGSPAVMAAVPILALSLVGAAAPRRRPAA